MSTVLDATERPRDYAKFAKWGLFALLAALTLTAIEADERFLINAKDAEWAHIGAFKWWLLPHGLAGATALLLGPFQFSERIRRGKPALHRLMGRVYISAISIAS